MKAFVQNGYGAADVYELVDVSKPTPSDDEVLVKVIASAVNDWDMGVLRAPWVMRMFVGLRRPRGKYRVMGCEMAGRVEAIGRNVGTFTVGDEVYGDLSGYRFGGFAEYVCIRARHLCRKPGAVSFEQAAAIPHAAELALLRALKPVGVYATVGGDKIFSFMLLAPLIAPFTRKRLKIVMLKPNKNLAEISELVGAGRLEPVIDQVFELADLRQALTRFRDARHVGKIVVRMP